MIIGQPKKKRIYNYCEDIWVEMAKLFNEKANILHNRPQILHPLMIKGNRNGITKIR